MQYLDQSLFPQGIPMRSSSEDWQLRCILHWSWPGAENEYDSLGFTHLEKRCQTNWTFIVHTTFSSWASHRSVAPCVLHFDSSPSFFGVGNWWDLDLETFLSHVLMHLVVVSYLHISISSQVYMMIYYYNHDGLHIATSWSWWYCLWQGCRSDNNSSIPVASLNGLNIN